MKKIFFIVGFMVVGLLLEVSGSFAAHVWIDSGPTVEDMRSATEVKNLAAKGSREDKLISAVKNGDLKNVEILIAAGAGLEARDNENMTALMIAAKKGYSGIVRILIDAGADISAKDSFGRTALFRAVDNNHVDIVKMLIAKGAAAAAEKEFENLFVTSVGKGNTEMVKALIVEVARVRDYWLDAAYGTASSQRRRNPELFNVMQKALNENKLISAVKNGDLKDVEILIAAGADLEARDRNNENMTALMTAAEKGYSDIVRILIDAGADISAEDDHGWTAFFMAADNNHVDIVKMLIAKGAAADKQFKMLFEHAVVRGNTEMVKALKEGISSRSS